MCDGRSKMLESGGRFWLGPKGEWSRARNKVMGGCTETKLGRQARNRQGDRISGMRKCYVKCVCAREST